MQIIDAVFVVAIIMFSAVVHEVAHGAMADWLGDKTARYAGRLTLNPLKHIDPFGSVILPMLLAFSNSPVFFGWAKPVPYNPYNLRPGRFSEALVAFAGPGSNLVIALIGGLIIRLGFFGFMSDIIFYIVVVNVMLCIFNLIPVPPLDGSKVLPSLLPHHLAFDFNQWRHRMEHNPLFGTGLIFVVILLLGNTFSNFVYHIAQFIAGI